MYGKMGLRTILQSASTINCPKVIMSIDTKNI